METSALHRPAPHRTTIDEPMDLQYQTPQQNLHSQVNPLSPVGQRLLPDNYYEESRKMKRGDVNEEKKGEDDDDELLFDIDEFLVHDEEALFPETDEDENEGAAIIAESPANSRTRSTTKETPYPDVASTNVSIVNIQNSTPEQSSSIIQKKKRKRKTRLKAKPNSVDDLVPPKRPLSAYNLHFREERKRCIAQASSSSKKKYNFEELGKIIGKGWRSLPVKEKRKLEARADADRERYRTEMIAYRNEKRRRAREEDQDSLILMKSYHQHRGIITPCPHSPQVQHSDRSFPPQRPDVQYPYQQYETVSPVQQRDYLVVLRYPHSADPTRTNHVRKVSLSISSPPYAAGKSNSKDQRSVNSSSPTVLSYASCSSWSGDEGNEKMKHKRKSDHKQRRDSSKEEVDHDIMASQSQGDVSESNNVSSENSVHPLNPSTNSASPKPLSRTSPPQVPVARVVAMPATDTLQRMLQDGQASRSPPQLPHASIPYAHVPSPHHYYHHAPAAPPHAYIPSPSLEVPADRHPYAPPPPPNQSSFVPPPPPHHLSSGSPVQAPQMLPLGMSILLRDPSTGQERSYRIQYAPQIMTAEQATHFHHSHHGHGAVGVEEKSSELEEPDTAMV